MMLRWIGAGCIVIGSGCLGVFYAVEHYKTVRLIRQIIAAIEYIKRELRYRQLPIPELLLNTADYCGGFVQTLLTQLSERICSLEDYDIASSMNAVLTSFESLPPGVVDLYEAFGKCMGQFDLQGQLENLDGVLSECKTKLGVLTQEQTMKLRSFQTLALCAGAAVAILLI